MITTKRVKDSYILYVSVNLSVRVPYGTPTQKYMGIVYLIKHINLMILIIKG
jgi:hypothetical protein